MPKELHLLSAVEAADSIRSGQLTSEALVRACLDHIGEDDIRAWVHLDKEAALTQARDMDRIRDTGGAMGVLHGVPVGVKDIIDTRSMPTEYGSPIFAGRQPEADATVINNLREAGAVIMGKTKTTEFAFVHPTDTLNPHNAGRTPGGSSSGSAAAVAAHHVPLAIGSQTGGSVLRPASYCGIYGFKPSRGMIARTGVLQTSKSLDHLGVFARDIADAAYLTNAIASFDPRDPASFGRPRPDFMAGACTPAQSPPKIARIAFPFEHLLDSDAKKAFAATYEKLGSNIVDVAFPDTFPDMIAAHITIHEYEFCQHLAHVIDTQSDALSDTLQEIVSTAVNISQAKYEDAKAVQVTAEAYFAERFDEFDAVLCPSSTGEAPPNGNGTGDPVFCRTASLCGLPAVSLPLLTGQNNMPIGLQLFGAVERDANLLQTANWVQSVLSA